MQRFVFTTVFAAMILLKPLHAEDVAAADENVFAACDDGRCVVYATAVSIDEIMTAAWLRVTRGPDGREHWHAAVALATGGGTRIRTIALPLRTGRSLGRRAPDPVTEANGFAFVELDRAKAETIRRSRAGSFAVIRAATGDGDVIEATIPLDGLRRSLASIEAAAEARALPAGSMAEELRAANIPPGDWPDRP